MRECDKFNCTIHKLASSCTKIHVNLFLFLQFSTHVRLVLFLNKFILYVLIDCYIHLNVVYFYQGYRVSNKQTDKNKTYPRS